MFIVSFFSNSNPKTTACDQVSRHQVQHPQSTRHPVTYALILLVVYICLGAFIYSVWKNQPFTDGAYYCFLSLTTIGSCDTFRNAFSATNEMVELIFYSSYLITGLIVTSAAVLLLRKNIIKLEFLSTISKFQKRNDEVAL